MFRKIFKIFIFILIIIFLSNKIHIFYDDILYYSLSIFCDIYNTTFSLWNSNLISGYPRIASISMMSFHPATLLLYLRVLSPAQFLNFLMWLYIFLAASLMYKWVFYKTDNYYSAIISAIIFTFSGFTINSVFKGHYMLLGSYCFYPLIFCLTDIIIKQNNKFLKLSKYDLCFIIIFSLQILAGHPQQVYYQCLILFPYILFTNNNQIKQKLVSFSKIIYLTILSGLICAVQLLPTYNFSKYAVRPITSGFNVATQYSASLNHFIQIVFPFFWGNSIDNTFFLNSFEDYSIFLGVPAVLFFIISFLFIKKKEVLFWVSIIIISIILAAGRYLPLYRFFYNLIPGFSLFRAPIRLFSITSFGISILAGLTLNNLIINKSRRTAKIIIWVLTILAVVFILKILFVGYIISFISKFNFNTSLIQNLRAGIENENLNIMLNSIRLHTVFAILFIGAFILFLKTDKKKIFIVLIISVCFVEYFYFASKILFAGKDYALLKPDVNSPIYQTILKDNDLFRTKYYENRLNINKNLYIPGLKNIDGYQNIIPNNIAMFQSFVNERYDFDNIVKSNRIFFENVDSEKFRLTGVKYLIARQELNYDNWELVLQDSGKYLYKNKNFIPFFFPVKKIILQSEEEYNFDKLSSITDYKKSAIVLSNEQLQKQFQTENILIQNINYTNDKINLQIYSDTTNFIVNLEPFDEDWKLTVNNKREKLYRTNLFFRGFFVNEGLNKVILEYKPKYFRIGLIVSVITILLILINLIYNKF